MNKHKWLLGVIVLGAAYIIAAPYITVYQMKVAAENHDGEALSEYVDFPSVRQSLKDQMNAMFMKEMSSNNPLAAFGFVFGGAMTNKIVDAFVTPSGLIRLMKGAKPTLTKRDQPGGESVREPFSNTSMFYESLNKFVVSIKDESGEEGKFILRRYGIGWKLTEIVIPMDK